VSSHTGIDDTPGVIGEYVRRSDKAWTQGNANPYSVAAELCAFAAWSPAEWQLHQSMLANTAQWVAEECAAFGIPVQRLSAAEAQGGASGVCQHVDLGAAGGGHWDCGPGFSEAMDQVIAMAAGGAVAPSSEEDKEMIICSTPSGKGYIVVKPGGDVFAYGDANYRGGANQKGHLSAGDKITDAAYVGQGDGYWLVAKSGAVFAYGDAPYKGGPN
jgi:hypothetical protein